MLKNKFGNKNRGFTIIEVLIVLAIAGLILLIVFLAVPNLQRNSRNTQRRNAAAATVGAINEFISNNNGAMPTTFAVATSTLTLSGAAGTTATTVGASSIYTTYSNPAALPASPPANATADTLSIYTNATCNGNALAAGTSTRQFVAFFPVEPSGNGCVAS